MPPVDWLHTGHSPAVMAVPVVAGFGRTVPRGHGNCTPQLKVRYGSPPWCTWMTRCSYDGNHFISEGASAVRCGAPAICGPLKSMVQWDARGGDMTEAEIEALTARIRHLEGRVSHHQVDPDVWTCGRCGAWRPWLEGLWTEDGAYDWDADGDPHLGSGGVEAMLRSDVHQRLIATGVAHFSGPPLIEIDGDYGTALNYSMVMRRDGDRFFLWRVSAVRWDLERAGTRWRVGRRTNRILKEFGGGRQLFEGALKELFEVREQ